MFRSKFVSTKRTNPREEINMLRFVVGGRVIRWRDTGPRWHCRTISPTLELISIPSELLTYEVVNV